MGDLRSTPQVASFPVWSVDEEQDGTIPAIRHEPLPTPEDMKKRVLFGIPLRSALTGQEVDNDTIQHYINSAISSIEHELDLYITPVTFKEKHDFKKEFWLSSYAYVKLNHPNILKVTNVSLSFSNADDTRIIDFPMEFIHVMPQEGTLQLVPAFGSTFSGFMLSAFSGTQFHALRQMGVTDFPGGFRITYVAGFDNGKVPSSIVSLIENLAAYQMLSIMGPVLFPHNSVGISIDGVSQSTSTMGPQFLSKRLDDLDKIIQMQKAAVKGYFLRSFQIDYV
jgi:hypothetical protein